MDCIRNGNFTSSEIYRLMSNGKGKGSFGVPFYSYIEECRMERRLCRSLDAEVDARPTSWGTLVEKRVFDLLNTDYRLCSKTTIQHPEIEYWTGTPDVEKTDTVGDIKSPITLKSFCQLVDPYIKDGEVIHKSMTIEAVRENHKDGEKFYWQLVSNAVLLNKPWAELIVHVPYLRELEDIRILASSAGELGEYTRWIYHATDEQLPYLVEGGQYKNLNVIRFPVPDCDKEALKERVIEAGKILNQPI